MLLKVDLQDGYVLKGAYNGQGEKVALLTDDNGYYLLVPKGGAVYITADIVKGDTYKIVFQNEDGTKLEEAEYTAGETPVYHGSTPTKASDDTYTYEFAGWDPTISPVTGAMTYKATFNKKAIPAEDEKTDAEDTKTADVQPKTYVQPKTGVEAPVQTTTVYYFGLAAALLVVALVSKKIRFDHW